MNSTLVVAIVVIALAQRALARRRRGRPAPGPRAAPFQPFDAVTLPAYQGIDQSAHFAAIAEEYRRGYPGRALALMDSRDTDWDAVLEGLQAAVCAAISVGQFDHAAYQLTGILQRPGGSSILIDEIHRVATPLRRQAILATISRATAVPRLLAA